MISWKLKIANLIAALLALTLAPSAFGHGISESQQQAILEGGNLQYLWLAALSVLVMLLAGWRLTESFRKLGGIANILLLAAGIGFFIYQMNGFFRVGAHHEDFHHEEGNTSPDPREHSHGGGPAHSHESEEHSHGVKAYGHPSGTEGSDSTGSHLEKAEPATPHEHPQEDGHSHDESVPHEH